MNKLQSKFQLGLINDIHYCSKRPVAKSTLTANVKMLNASSADLIVNLGDNVMDAMTSSMSKLKNDISDVFEAFRHLKKDLIGAIGNHDFVNENRNPDELIELWSNMQANPYNVVTKQLDEHWSMVVLPSINIVPESLNGYESALTEKQFAQFEEVLRNNAELANPKHIVVVSHVPIMSITPLMDRKHPMNRKSYEFPANHIHADAYKLVNMMSNYPQIQLCLSGHMHMVDEIKYKDITYACCGSLCGMWWSLPTYKGHEAGNMFVDLYENGDFKLDYRKFDHIK